MAYKQAKARRKKLLKTYETTKNSCTSGGVAFNDERGFYYKYPASNAPGRTKQLKKISNKRVRKATTDIGDNGNYKKQLDYKRILF